MTRLLRTPATTIDGHKERGVWTKPGFVYFQVVNATVTAKVEQPRRVRMIGSREPTAFPVSAPVMAWNAVQAFSKQHDLPLDMFMCYRGKEGDEVSDIPQEINFFYGNPQFSFVIRKPRERKANARQAAEKIQLR